MKSYIQGKIGPGWLYALLAEEPWGGLNTGQMGCIRFTPQQNWRELFSKQFDFSIPTLRCWRTQMVANGMMAVFSDPKCLAFENAFESSKSQGS